MLKSFLSSKFSFALFWLHTLKGLIFFFFVNFTILITTFFQKKENCPKNNLPSLKVYFSCGKVTGGSIRCVCNFCLKVEEKLGEIELTEDICEKISQKKRKGKTSFKLIELYPTRNLRTILSCTRKKKLKDEIHRKRKSFLS